jgi:Mg-chelatase subunit ChlD
MRPIMKLTNTLNRKTCSAWAIALTAILFICSSAQAAVEINYPNGVKDRPVQDKNGSLIRVMVVADNALLLAWPKADGPGMKRAKYGDALFLADSHTANGKTFHLAGELAERGKLAIKGWLRAEDVLLRREALQSEYKIFRKAIIVNKWNDAGGKMELNTANALNGPGTRLDGSSFDKIRELGLFQFYYVFKTVERPGKPTSFLLSETPVIPRANRFTENVIGWVDGRRVIEWDTRQAIEFNKSNLAKRLEEVDPAKIAEGAGGVAIFEEEAELKAFMDGETTLNDKPLTPIAEEDTRHVERWSYETPRFPLFKAKANDLAPELGNILELGYIGDQIYVEGGTKGLSAPEVARDQAKIREARSSVREINLVFAIDATGSMKRFMQASAESVVQVAADIDNAYRGNEENKPLIRYSVVLYRDYQEENKKRSFLTARLPLTESVEQVEGFLLEATEDVQGGGTPPEAVFHGILQAIEASDREITNPSSFKIMILIGDQGNHAEDKRGYTVEGVAARLKQSKFDDFAGIHVMTGPTAKNDSGFKEQVQKIGNLMAIKNRLALTKPEQLAPAIVKRAQERVVEMELSAKAIEEVAQGVGLAQIGERYGVRVARKVTQAIEAAGVNPRNYVNQSASIFGRGWTTRNSRNGQEQCNLVHLVEQHNIDMLVGILAGFTSKLVTRQDIQDVWGAVLKSQLGESNLNIDRPISDLITEYAGLPMKSGILKKSLNELASEGDDFLADAQDELERQKERMVAFRTNRKIEIVEQDNGRFEVKDMGERKVWWQGADQKYAWITADELP